MYYKNMEKKVVKCHNKKADKKQVFVHIIIKKLIKNKFLFTFAENSVIIKISIYGLRERRSYQSLTGERILAILLETRRMTTCK